MSSIGISWGYRQHYFRISTTMINFYLMPPRLVCQHGWPSHCNSSELHTFTDYYQECNIPASSPFMSVDGGREEIWQSVSIPHHPVTHLHRTMSTVRSLPINHALPTETVVPFPSCLVQLNCCTVHIYKLTTKLKINEIYSSARLQLLSLSLSHTHTHAHTYACMHACV
jgi:hypothetical protein